MITRKQLLFSILLLFTAAAVTWSQVREGEGTPPPGADSGHDHATMTGQGQSEPVRIDPVSARRIGLSFTSVVEKPLRPTVRAVGTVTYDETRLSTVNPKIEGWVEELFADFSGAPVTRGDPLLSVYSPRLVTAQEELVLAVRLGREARGERAGESARNLLESARRRLANWDISDAQIRRLEEGGEPSKTLFLDAPATGIVVEKNVVEGDRIMPGMTVFRIADLSTVWIEADVYEKDLGLVREGQKATVRFEAYPGRSFSARVTYVYPTISVEARTARVRLELPNPGQELKPGMYAGIEIHVPPSTRALVVPRSSVLDTGRRTLVFVQNPDQSLAAREVTPGRAVGPEIEILRGLDAGDRIVSSAAFLVDAESSLGTLSEDGSTSADMSSHEVGGH